MFRPDQNRAALFADALRTVAGVVLLTALAVGPLNYGSTRLMPFETLIALVATAGGAWLLAAAWTGGWRRPPRAVLAGALLVGVVGALWAVVLPAPVADAFTQEHLARVTARWPGSVVPRSPVLLLTWALAAIAALFAFCDLLREPVWRRATAAVMLGTGGVVAVVGLLENATHANRIYWTGGPRLPGAFFGPFFHHTSAGAYLNSVWPLGLGLALAGLRQGAANPRRRIAVVGALGAALLVLAAHAGHVSRLPQVLAAAGFAAFALWAGLWSALGRIRGLRAAVAGAAALAALLVCTLGAGRVGQIRARWGLLRFDELRGGRTAVANAPESQWPRLMRDDLFVPSDHRAYALGDRGAAYAAAVEAVRLRPWLGWGPGGWTAAASVTSADPFVRTFFLYLQFTHEDYLQTLVEWGAIGGLGWLLLIPAAIPHALRRLRLRPGWEPLGAAAVIALGTVLLQSLIDFPLQIPALQLNAIALAAFAWTVPDLPAPAFPHERL